MPISVSGKVVVKTEKNQYYLVDLQTGNPIKQITSVIYSGIQPTEVRSPNDMWIATFYQGSSKDYSIDVETASNRHIIGYIDGSPLPDIPSDDYSQYVNYLWLDNQHIVVSDTTKNLYIVNVSSAGVSSRTTIAVAIPSALHLRIVDTAQ